MAKFRVEKDVLGEVKVPEDAYYGSWTERAKGNFPISGRRIHPGFIRAYVMVKRSAALANMKIGKLDRKKCDAIVKACNEILAGKLHDQFIVDAFQAGAGTSTNMNVNEVVANRAIEILGGKKGDYSIVHPNDHVNMSQSTNDTFHTVTHISTYLAVRENLLPALETLKKSFEGKAEEFKDIIKVGRTHLQDAVPMTLGQEFGAYASAISHSIKWLQMIVDAMLELSIGGTAVGTSINAGSKYVDAVLDEIRKVTGVSFGKSKNFFNASQNQNVEAEVSAALKSLAVALGKISNDLRLLSSGPRAGIGEITLPEVQPGSSIMPGKINPTIPEMLNMVCFEVIGNDITVAEAAQGGQLELNVFMPIIAFNLLYSVEILTSGIKVFTNKCVNGIGANKKRIEQNLEGNLSLATALVPHIGYKKASEVARKAYLEDKTVRQVCLEMKLLKEKELDKILDMKKLAGLEED